MENNQTGIIVRFLYPTPNTLMLPSLLYKKSGLKSWTTPNIIVNNMMAINGILFLANVLNIILI